ncbi:MAG: flavodoxin family protein [Hyphomicrobium sp.]
MVGSKILVVFYSRSGTTRKIAQALAKAMRCDLEEISEPKSRAGFFGYTRSLLEALLRRPAVIAAKKRDVAAYDLVIVGTPVWGSSLSSPARAYLMATAPQLPDVAFFCCFGGSGSESTFAQMTAVTGKKPRACCAITQGEVQAGTFGGPLATFEKALSVMTADVQPVRV